MARVVQRRGGPPYLLIVFVFTTLVAAVLAVIFYSQSSNKDQTIADKDRQLVKLKTEHGYLSAQQIPALVKAITGNEGLKPDQALAAKKRVLNDDNKADPELKYAKAYSHLIQAVEGLDEVAGKKDERINALTQDLKLANAELTKKEESFTQVEKTYKDEADRLKTDLEKAQDDFKKEIAAQKAQRDRLEADKNEIIRQKDLKIAVLMKQLDDLKVDVQQRDANIVRLREIIDDLKGLTGRTGELVLRKADGKVIKVVTEQNLCYINLGKQDNIKPGLPLSVYAFREGIPKDGLGKAKLQVIFVGPTTSECRIVESDRGDSIAVGDLVANLIFSPTRTHQFVVEGEFDLYGTGQPDALANQKIRKLIEGFGGKITDEVSVSTDFVVMGTEPPRPPKPGEDAPPATWAAYKDKMARYSHYNVVKAAAVGLRIPVLNTNRFLAFSGFVPKKRLQE